MARNIDVHMLLAVNEPLEEELRDRDWEPYVKDYLQEFIRSGIQITWDTNQRFFVVTLFDFFQRGKHWS